MQNSDSYYKVQLWCIFILLASTQYLCASGQDHEGDDCNLNGISGTCILITNCTEVLRSVASERPQVCGYSNLIPIVCCPKVQLNETLEINKEVEIGQKSKDKCAEYSSYIYEWVLPDNETDPEKKVKINTCGHIASALVIGHDVTTPREYPHMAILGQKAEDNTRHWVCGGTLISEEFVMTVAHCTIIPAGGGELRWVRLGEYSLDMHQETETQDFGIDEIIRHPDYNPRSFYNDIALVRLDRRATLNKFVIPACLHTEYEIGHKTAAATGWGKADVGETENIRMDLAKAVLEIFSQEECNATFFGLAKSRLEFGITESMLCAGHRTLSRGTCQGDAGGPLQVYLKNPYCMYDVIGILSFGKGCRNPGVPEVFSRVSHYVQWIESVVWPE